MGQWVTRLIHQEFAETVELAAQMNRSDTATESMYSVQNTDVVIDFSVPAAMQTLAQAALKKNDKLPAFIIGSTGWKPEEKRVIESLSERTPVLMSSNFSTGMMALIDLLKTASPVLKSLQFTPVIVEAHHKSKKDSPSGSALSIQQAISSSQSTIHSIRAGDVVGDHEISFFGGSERILLGHYVQDRSVFARGAIECAIWLVGKRQKNPSIRGMIGVDQFFAHYKDLKN